MRLESLDTLPLLHHDVGIGSELGLDAAHAFGIDRGAVLDAALLRMDRRHVGVEDLQDCVAHAGLGGDDGEDVDHAGRSLELLRSGEARCAMAASTPPLPCGTPMMPSVIS